MNIFDMHTKIIIGGDSFPEILAGITRVFIVTDDFMASSGAVSYVTARLDTLSIEWKLYSKIKADPDIDMVTEGVSQINEFSPQAVIAFGGGSPIDAAKAIVYFAKNQYGMKDCPFIAIPTTSGTGTEVSKFSVITDREKGLKYPLVDSSLLPDYAILDAELTKTVPQKITADTGLDVLTHAIEAYVCTNSNSFTDALAEKAIKIVYQHLLICYREPENMEARQNMHNASCLAGAAFSNSGLGLNHGMAHALGGMAHIPHGRANAILLPYVISFNAGCNDAKLTEVASRYAMLSSSLGLESSSTRQTTINLVRTIRKFMHEMGIPATIRQAGVSKSDFESMLPKMIEAAMQDKCTATNPIIPSKEQIEHIYRTAFGS